ncbi:hypothetical protein AB0L25_19575 [Spirillospora sp. NPDC052242]
MRPITGIVCALPGIATEGARREGHVMSAADRDGPQGASPAGDDGTAVSRMGSGAITCGLLVVLAVLAGVLFVVGAQIQGTILTTVGVIVTAFGGAAVLTPAARKTLLQVANNLLIALTVFGLIFLGYKAVAYKYRTITVTSEVRLPEQQIGPGDSIALHARIPSPRRHLTLTFGWKDANPEIGGCAVDAVLTIYGNFGYPRSPVQIHGIKDPVKIDLGSARRSAEVQVRLDSADSRCLGTLYVKHAKAHT